MSYSAHIIANEFIELEKKKPQEERNLRHERLQLYVIMSHGYHLGYTGQPLIKDAIQAWPIGPIIPELYDSLRYKGPGVIDNEITIESNEKHLREHAYEKHITFVMDIIRAVHSAHQEINLGLLQEEARSEGSPWFQVWHLDQHEYGVIHDSVIERHYYNLLISNGIKLPQRV